MFTYHGWIEIEHQDHLQQWVDGKIDYPEYRKRLLEITNNLETISEKQFDIRSIDLKIMNGTNGIVTIHLSGERNHFHDGVEKLMNWIRDNAPMSHGLVFCRDSEIDRYNNKYWVLRLAKEKVQELKDSYLSPIDEIIENVIEENKKRTTTRHIAYGG